MIFYNSRQLSKYLDVNLLKWKRWVREFLPPDPLGGLQSGYARQFNLKEAFRVFLGGYLVSVLKFTIPEARQILKDLDNWLKIKGFYALQPRDKANSFNDGHVFRIYILSDMNQKFAYLIQRMRKSEILEDGGRRLDHYDQQLIGAREDPLGAGLVAGGRFLCIHSLYWNHFLKHILPKAKNRPLPAHE